MKINNMFVSKIKNVFSIMFVVMLAMFAQYTYADTYNDCVADGQAILKTTAKDGLEKAKTITQKTTIEQCWQELRKIENSVKKKSDTLLITTYMTPEQRVRWSTLFRAIDYKKFRGTRLLIADYYRL